MGFREQMRGWAQSEPFRVSYVVGLYEGDDGGPPTAEDAAGYAEATGLQTPVLADPLAGLTVAMPYDGSRPTRCALSPGMEMLACYEGEPGDPDTDPAILAIRDHWEAHGGE